MIDYIAEQDRALLERHGLASFEALWALQLEPVDEPNTERGGWSSVCRLELDGVAYYLKRQSGYLTRSLLRPAGEPTFAREIRTIFRYAKLGIPALQAAFYAERPVDGERCAVLLTRALDGWQDLDNWLVRWSQLASGQREAILNACGQLARRLHQAGQMHGCFYPKHIFLQEHTDGFAACLIDLEKTRPLLLGRRDRIKDIEPLLRRALEWSPADVRVFLNAYLQDERAVDDWAARLGARRKHKESRR
ncbi:lipopolysaccharide kinase InaA family protein [Pseudomonas sp. 5P_3.1_Bac2]|uniref:lipopolysaccharide kinase InaA family protein n=1 Tax=Pseudomonas sp. 5P_3.1_Bac2 TaxID=2971617 RepID=UPI0021C79DAD|nr:lipopolysaccharide kinase InaA family protein [Pseudomonas sp. 5P_3.1_Bac2]MCU1718343.1 lipopolysaccharide kinase InaA family protein [Pseudomonas sp. 5P_3.1_Bac2]